MNVWPLVARGPLPPHLMDAVYLLLLYGVDSLRSLV